MRKRGSVNQRDYDLIGLLNQTTETIFRARQKELDQHHISTSQGAVLFITRALGDKATISEISRWLLRKPHTVSEIVSRMEKKGLLKKARVPKRKSIIRVTLTPKGLEAYRKSKKRQSFRNIISSLTLAERRKMVLCLQKLKESAVRELGNQDETHLNGLYF
jgi:DNA-binding MarR family transcriptional regulator